MTHWRLRVISRRVRLLTKVGDAQDASKARAAAADCADRYLCACSVG